MESETTSETEDQKPNIMAEDAPIVLISRVYEPGTVDEDQIYMRNILVIRMTMCVYVYIDNDKLPREITILSNSQQHNLLAHCDPSILLETNHFQPCLIRESCHP